MFNVQFSHKQYYKRRYVSCIDCSLAFLSVYMIVLKQLYRVLLVFICFIKTVSLNFRMFPLIYEIIIICKKSIKLSHSFSFLPN